MANEFLEAVKNSSDEDSEERYQKVKKEEAGTQHEDMAEKRYQELKEEAKQEFVEKQREKEQEDDSEDDPDEDSESFVTY